MRRGTYFKASESDFDRSFRHTGFFIKGVFVLVALGMVAAVAGVVWTVTKGNDNAENSARDWAHGVQGSTGVKCTSYDTDGDGYVSCTIFRESGDPLFVECGSGLMLNEGCRAPKAVLRTR